MKKILTSIAVVTLLTFSLGTVAFAQNTKIRAQAPGTRVEIEVAKNKGDKANQREQLKSEKAEKNAQKEIKKQEKIEKKEMKAAQKELKNQAKAELKARKLEERIKVKGRNLKFDVPPVIKEGRTLIPVRAVTEGLGAKVTYDYETKQITIIKGDIIVVMTLGTKTLEVNGESRELDVPADTICNRTFVPLRFLAEVFGEKVEYDEETGDIEIGDTEDEEDDEDEEDLEDDNEVDDEDDNIEGDDETEDDNDDEE
ncbi:MAG: copper amine oxidase N-terminal domain-containing protein [Zhaonellaceae bacterium]|jgi:hypothetical protein